jgi:non-homologous end joining protein Ku
VIDAKMKGRTIKAAAAPTPSPMIDLMAALKRSLAGNSCNARGEQIQTAKATSDRRQAALLLPLSGARNRKVEDAS